MLKYAHHVHTHTTVYAPYALCAKHMHLYICMHHVIKLKSRRFEQTSNLWHPSCSWDAIRVMERIYNEMIDSILLNQLILL